MDANKVHTVTLNGGIDSDTALEYLDQSKKRYALNCISTSSSEGNKGVITNPKGNVLISTPLPEGVNKVIGVCEDEERNRFIYALYNSEGYDSWFMYDATSNTIVRIIQSITDSGGDALFNWKITDIILGVNIVDGDKLYWTVYGSDHPARKINIPKIINREEPGYNDVISSSLTLAFKEPPYYAPQVAYFTNSSKKSNNIYRNLFKFATRYIYDDYEYSTFSDYSEVAVPDEEDITGTKGVPLINNGIKVGFLSGNSLVRRIELVMKKTNPDGGETDWVSLAVFDKQILGISDDTLYEYEFYNENSYLAIDQSQVFQPYSSLPDFPKGQEYSGNVLFYSNFKDGNPVVNTDFTLDVVYEDLFVPDSTANVPNNPSLIYNLIDVNYEKGGYRHKRGYFVVGPDVRAGNVFRITIDKSKNDKLNFSYTATLNDKASTIASRIRSWLLTIDNATKGGGWTSGLNDYGGGSYGVEFNFWNHSGRPYIEVYTSVTPVNYSKLKDTGNSVRNEKLGSAFRYGIIYENKDTSKKSLVYVNDNNLVNIANLSDLGALKKPLTQVTINHLAPSWAKRYQIVRTRNLIKSDYIQILIQSKTVVKDYDNNNLYQDLSIGSLFTYQQIHSGLALKYEFKKGDRIRLLKTYTVSSTSWAINTNVIDYDIIDYFPVVETEINGNVSIDGSTSISISPDTADAGNIGNYIRINGSERLIVGASGASYIVDSSFTESDNITNTNRTYPTYTIINRRGVIRIKENSDFPIDVVDGSKYALVEVYRPAQSFGNEENEPYYEIGAKFDITEVDGVSYHSGNIQSQTDTQSAIISIEGLDNYVRNRQLPTNNALKNTQMIFTSIEDRSYSDFYVSDLSSYGRVNRLDDSRGVVNLEESVIHSQNRIEGTKVNGLSMFLNINRRDYNDKNGPIERLMFHDGILYILKNLKIGYVPVRASIITDTSGQNRTLASSSNIIPDRLEYIQWEDGVGGSPESAFRWGNDIWLMCPNSGVALRIQGGGGQVVSTPLRFDKDIRDKVTFASLSGAKIVGGYDPFIKMCIWNVEPFDEVAFNGDWNTSNSRMEEVPFTGNWNIVSNPSNGIIQLVGDVITYYPNTNYVGNDSFSYRDGTGIVRYVFVTVVEEGGYEIEWLPDGASCVVAGGVRTGYVEFSVLREYNSTLGSYTGNEKPNSSSDPDYVAPYEDLDECPLTVDYVNIGRINRRLGDQSIDIHIESTSDFNVLIKETASFSSATIDDTGIVSTPDHTLNIPALDDDAYIFIVVDGGNYDDVSVVNISGAYFYSANFNSLPNLTEVVLDQSALNNINQFTSLSVNQLTSLQKIGVIGHRIASFDFTPNTALEDIDVSSGYVLVDLTISDWSILRILKVHNSLFTGNGYSPVFVDSIIQNMDNISVSPEVLQYGNDIFSGVLPSSSVLSNYNSLLSKSVSVIGKNPDTVSYTQLSISSNSPLYNIDYTLTLGMALSVDIDVHLSGSYITDGNTSVVIDETVTITAGNTTYSGTVTTATPVVVHNIFVDGVTPNPAGGITVYY